MKCTDHAQLIAQRLDEAELFSKHFGSFSKADYEVLMFSIYLNMLDQPIQDYELSLQLGITESKVRALRVKSQLLYPQKLCWQEELEKALRKGTYDEKNMTITVMIEDPSVQNMLKHEIEKSYGPVHLSFNPKIMTLPIESYLILALKEIPNESDVLKDLSTRWKETVRDAGEITKESLLHRSLKAVRDKDNAKILLGIFIKAVPKAAPFLKEIMDLIF